MQSPAREYHPCLFMRQTILVANIVKQMVWRTAHAIVKRHLQTEGAKWVSSWIMEPTSSTNMYPDFNPI